jgi:PAS domain S-box-containing protein
MRIKISVFLSITLAFILGVSVVIYFVDKYNDDSIIELQSNENLTKLINDAGRQRMLSQRITLTFYAEPIENEAKSAASVERTEFIRQFIAVHESIESFTIELSLDYPDREKVFKHFQVVKSKHTDLVKAFNDRTSSDIEDSNSTDQKELFASSSEYLVAMDEMVRLIEGYAQWNLSKSIDQAIVNKKRIIRTVILAAFFVYLMSLYLVYGYTKSLERLKVKLTSANEKRKKKLERMEFLTSTINVGVWEKDVIEGSQFWSRKLYEMLEFDFKEIPGTAESFQSQVHPEDLKILLAASEESIKLNEPRTVEIRVRKKSGEYIWVEATGNAKRNEKGKTELLMAGIVNVNQKKILENQLINFVSRAPAAIAMFDSHMRYLAYSDKWLDFYELEDELLHGKNHYETFPDTRDAWKKIHLRCLEGETLSNEADPFERADGTTQYIKWEVSPWYQDQDKVGGIIMFTEDVTQSTLKAQKLSSEKAEAERLSSLKTEFLSAMSHEIRTPLNGIIGVSNLLKSEEHLPSQEQYIDILNSSSKNLLWLINDVLDINKIESRNLQLHESHFDFNEFIESIIQTHDFAASQKGLRLVTAIDDTIPSILIFDKTRLAQVLNNLLSNAIKFTYDGQITLNIRKTNIEGQSCTLYIQVSDTGIGISNKDLEVIFDPYKQASAYNKGNLQGTGLGLHLSRELVRLFGSDLIISSEPDIGTQLQFEIKAKIGDRSKIDEASSEDSKHLRFTDDTSVLVVEDNHVNQLIANKFLSDMGLKISFADTGNGCISKVKNYTYDLILMDIQLPDISGVDCAKTIRNELNISSEQTPIIAVTADVTDQIKKEIYEVGMQKILYKPLNKNELLIVLGEYLELRNDEDFSAIETTKAANDSLQYYCGDNVEARKEMIQLLVQNIREIKSSLITSSEEKNADILRSIRHKALSTFKILNSKEIETSLKDLQTQFDIDNFDQQLVELNMTKLEQLEALVIQLDTQ